MDRIHKWSGSITLLSPLSHNGDEAMGVDAKFRRIAINSAVDNKRVDMPVYSGNAFRGILRRIAAAQYLRLLGILEPQSLGQRLYYLFFSGGSLDKGSDGSYLDIQTDKRLREMAPFMSLFGGAQGNRIHSGKLGIGLAMPVCREAAAYTGWSSERSYFEMLDEIFYTRRDDYADKPDPTNIAEKPEIKQAAQQMRYTVECLIPGTVLDHSIHLKLPTEVELACWGAIWKEFSESPILGGISARGHGKVMLDYKPEFPDPEPYYKYIEGRRAEILESDLVRK